jgi:hypothetical protein
LVRNRVQPHVVDVNFGAGIQFGRQEGHVHSLSGRCEAPKDFGKQGKLNIAQADQKALN